MLGSITFGVLDDLSQKDDACEERGAVVPASVRALAEGGTEVPVDRLVCRQFRLLSRSSTASLIVVIEVPWQMLWLTGP